MSHCEEILRAAKKSGVSEAEGIFCKKRIITVRLTDSQIAEIKENYEQSIAARLIDGKKIFAVKTTNPDAITRDIENGPRIARYLKPKEFWRGLAGTLSPSCKKIERTFDKRLKDISGEQAADIAQAMLNESAHPKVTSVSGSLNIVSEYYEASNTNGLEYGDESTFISAMVNADSKNDDTTVSGIGQECCRTLNQFDPQKAGPRRKADVP